MGTTTKKSMLIPKMAKMARYPVLSLEKRIFPQKTQKHLKIQNRR